VDRADIEVSIVLVDHVSRDANAISANLLVNDRVGSFVWVPARIGFVS